jgi:hypothetical protein
VDVLIGSVLMAMWPLALCAVIVPLAILATYRWHLVPAVLLHLATLTLLVTWFVAMNADMDSADRTGGQGHAWAGAGWFLGAMATATATIVVATRRPTRATTV